MSITLIVGDVHLGKSLSMGRPGIGTSLNGRVADQFYLLDWVLDQAIENHVTSIILTGDICEDVNPDYVLMVHFIQWCKRCEAHNIDVHIVAGNHDIKRSGSHYLSPLDVIQSAELPNTVIYKQTDTIYSGTVGFTLMPFRDRRSLNCELAHEAITRLKNILEYESADIPNTYDKVLIGHLALEGSICVGDEFDNEANELMCPINMFQGYNYVWMGHIHRPQVRCQQPYVAHVGSLDLSDFGETDHTKIVILFDSHSREKFKEIVVPSRPLRLLQVEVPPQTDTTDAIMSALEAMDQATPIRNSIIKIEARLQGIDATNANRPVIQEVVYEKYGAHFICSFTETRTTLVIPQEKRRDLDNSISPRAAIKLWAKEKVDGDDRNTFIKMALETIEQSET